MEDFEDGFDDYGPRPKGNARLKQTDLVKGGVINPKVWEKWAPRNNKDSCLDLRAAYDGSTRERSTTREEPSIRSRQPTPPPSRERIVERSTERPSPRLSESEELREIRQNLIEAAVHAKNLLSVLLAVHERLNG